MKYGGSDAMIHIPSFIEAVSGTGNIIWETHK
jgi:hypothetical protein